MEKEIDEILEDELDNIMGGIPFGAIDLNDPSNIRKDKIEQLREEQEKLKQFQKDIPSNDKTR